MFKRIPNSSPAVGLALGLALGALLIVAGCHAPHGAAFPNSKGSITWFSTQAMPKSITMRDLRSDEVFFTMDIPTGKQLTVQFRPGEGDDPIYTPDIMEWMVWDIGTSTGKLLNAMTVPNAASRRIDVDVSQDVQWAEQPAGEALRTDQEADRPDWWTARGGEKPEGNAAVKNYDE